MICQRYLRHTGRGPAILGILLALLPMPLLRGQPVLVNEIMYHPPGTNLLEQWFELYNPRTSTVNLSGWRVTQGVDFTFPTNTTLAAGGYLVVAADAATFTSRNPGVTNVVAGWAGTLDRVLEISDLGGHVTNRVEFHPDGDWATRVMGPVQYNRQGWEWFALHDGYGSSLELINPTLPNTYAHNWGANANTNSTPGHPNSIAATNAAPFITEVAHAPIIPQPSDPVTVSARIVDEHTNGLAVTLDWRIDGAAGFTSAAMLDDGAHGDGLAGDGIYGAILPAQPNGTVVEFYLQARDPEGHTRTHPSTVPPPGPAPRTANLLYQVDNGVYTGSQPIYRIIMTDRERAELYALGRGCPDSDSDAAMNATWITTDGVVSGGTTTQLRYNVGVRNRGHGTRQSNPNNYHVDIPEDRLWKKAAGINLNSQYAHSQVLGSAVFNRLEVPMADSRAVQMRVNSVNLMATVGGNSFGSYAANEQYNNDFVKRSFPLDPRGNSYRGIRDSVSCDPTFNGVADLTWHGANIAVASYTNAYFKQNNFLEDDWSDLIRLIGVLNQVNGTTPATYVADVQRVLNVDEWMRYMAINTLLDNTETCLANGYGDDYSLYRGTNDTRFQVLPYDLDSVMGRGLTPIASRNGIFLMTALPVMDRFMKTPEFAPIYYRWLKTLADTAFSWAQMDPFLDQLLKNYVPPATLDTMKAFNASRVSYVASQIPLTLTVTNALPVSNGHPRTTSSTLALSGQANAIDTRAVLVNGAPATWTAWQGTWNQASVPLRPGLNRVLIQALDAAGRELSRTNTDVWYDDGSVQTVGGTIAANTAWTAAGGPYSVTTSLTVANGATLTIEPGTCVYFGSGVNLIVANGGRLLAEGTLAAPIRFTQAPGDTSGWGGVTINGGSGSPETRIAYAWFEGNGNTCIEVAGGTLYLDHTAFGTTTHQYVSLDGASFVVSDCVFPTPTAAFELVHGTGGIKAGGRGLFLRNFFGEPNGYNDVVDFTGGNRPTPIVQFINNVFSGASDDMLDLDGTDAWVEGNLFLHAHKNGSPDSSSAVSGGNDSGNTSEITIIGNLFYDCDQAATGKQGNFYTFLNNTVVHQTHAGGLDTDGAVINLADDGTTEGAGMYLEGNVLYDIERLVRNHTSALVTFNNNLLMLPWSGPGTGNTIADPRLNYIPQLGETHFTTWEQAQVMREWFGLRPDSPARGAGPNGRDLGGVIPHGASVSGEPVGTNNLTTATLKVGTVRTGSGIPTAGWPNGSGYAHYQWRLDSGAWSAETPTPTPIALSGLANGPHHVDVIGRRDSGWYQDNPALGPDAIVATTATWTVDTSYLPPAPKPTVRLNEVLAKNATTFTNAGTLPDLIELYNYGPAAVDLSGMGLTDSTTNPHKFRFPAGTSLAAGVYLVVYADPASAAPGTHLGFSLKQGGDDISLFASTNAGGVLLDSVTFGLQLPDLSLGRVADGAWTLCVPAFGGPNVTAALGNERRLRINEWLADAQFAATHDFLELYNPDSRPVALGGLFLSDAAGAPDRSPVPPLSFIAGAGYAMFIADGNPGQGADHVNFKLSPDVGLILLSAADLTTIDAIRYGPQHTDVAQGRSPSGSDIVTSFPQPTAGGPNPGPAGAGSVTNVTAIVQPLLDVTATAWRYNNSGANLGTAWVAPTYADAAWSSGFGLFGFETTPAVYPYPIQTPIPAPDQANGHITVYYRTHFQWTNSPANFQLVATNFLDDGAVFYLNGVQVDRLRVPASFTYTTTATNQPVEGAPEVRFYPTNQLAASDNVMAVEVHQSGSTSSDDVFGLSLAAIQFTTNVINHAAGVPIVLNEVLARNQTLTNLNGLPADYVELYNPSTNSADLTNLSLSNDPNQPRKWVFPPDAALAPFAYLVVYCEGSFPSSATNTGFGLNTQGDTLLLFDRPADGGGLVDAVRFGLQVSDRPIGRIPDGTGNWTLNIATPRAANEAAGLGTISALRINEWMADPVSGSDWFELYNTDSQPVALGGLFLTDNLTDKTRSPIEPLSFLGVGADAFLELIADGQTDAGADHVGFSLKKSGGSLGLFSPVGVQLDAIAYGAQVTGVSQGRLPDGSTRALDFPTTATPGGSNFLPLPDVVIDEILAHTDPPLEDAVELFNPTGTPVALGGWYLSNNESDFKKYRFPANTVLAAGGYAVIYEAQFNVSSSPTAFTFNSAHGDAAIVSAADALGQLTGYRAQVKFGATANGVSMGRYPTSVGVDFTALSARTFGQDNPATVAQFRTGAGLPNAGPRSGPVVINEILYFATNALGESPDLEFIELQNLTGAEVPLFDPAYPTNTWRLRDGVSFDFPTNTSLAAGVRLLLVGFSPTDPELLNAFRLQYGVAGTVPIFGPWAGRLDNNGDSLELYAPDTPQAAPHPDAGFVPYILVDRVRYSPLVPWPTGAALGNVSLQRIASNAYGNDPANWLAAAPTAGRANDGGATDTDGDGLPDSWEMFYFGTLARDGTGDFDGDSMTDVQEYLAGTDPTSPTSVLRIDSATLSNDSAVLGFVAVGGHSYTVQYRDDLVGSGWQKLTNVPPPGVTGPVQVTDLDAGPGVTRFYRLATPAIP